MEVIKTNDQIELELKTTSEDGVEFIVRFSGYENIINAFDRLDWMKSAYRFKNDAKKIRTICQTNDGRIFYPIQKTNLPKARWAFVTAVASFPIGVPVDFILEKTGLSSSELSSYCTSKKNPSYKYFFIDSGLLQVHPDGIGWVYKNLIKDGQIENNNGENDN